MAKNKDKRKPKQKSEEMANKEETISETIETKEGESQDQSGSEKKKQKKDIDSNQEVIDKQDKGSKAEECHQDDSHDNDNDSGGEQDAQDKPVKTRKRKKSKAKNKKKKSDDCGPDKWIKAFRLSQSLVANMTCDKGIKCLKIGRDGSDSSDSGIDVTADEWKAFMEVVPDIDTLFVKE